MNRKVQVYIEGQRIELFNDEQIQVNSTQQNIADISKTYTDFSQSFTVPASELNNQIFQHFYQTDVNASIDHNIRRNAFIEIDLTFFRRGKIQIEGSKLKDGKAESYTLTFYGEGRTLLDYFGEDLLSDLDYTSLNHEYNGTEVRARVIDAGNTYDVKYPLISSKRVWTYSGQAPTSISPAYYTIPTNSVYDLNHTSGHMHYEELFPAVRVSKIFEAIETKYGIDFTGSFLGNDRFTKLFLWYKNKNEMQIVSESFLVDMSSVTTPTGLYDLTGSFNTTADTLHIQELTGVLNHLIEFEVTSASTSDTYYIDVYQNGNLINSIQGTSVQSYFLDFIQAVIGLDSIYTIKVRGQGANNIALQVSYEVLYFTGTNLLQDSVVISAPNVIYTSTVDLAANAPVMKIADFFAGILKVFNMTVYSITDGEYWVEPLDDWYSKGAVIDVSEYVDVNTIEHARMPLYKKISFKYQDSECFLNKNFSQTFSRSYGDTTYQYNYDGGEFTVEVPFENLLQQKFNGTQVLQVGYSLNSEYTPYIPKPVLLYQYQILSKRILN